MEISYSRMDNGSLPMYHCCREYWREERYNMNKDIPDWINTLALGIYQVIQKYDAMPRFQEMVNDWAEDHGAEVSDFLTWKKQRALHFENNVTTDVRLQDRQAGPPEDGWQFQGDVRLIEKQTESGLQSSPKLIQGWVPPELATRPEITRILPLSRDHVLSLVEKYAILATIYDYGRKGTAELPPWEWPDLGERQTPQGMANAMKCMGFEALCRYVEDFAPEEEGWLRAMLGEVEKDVAKWAGGQPSDLKDSVAGTVAETRTDRKIRWI